MPHKFALSKLKNNTESFCSKGRAKSLGADLFVMIPECYKKSRRVWPDGHRENPAEPSIS
jgi:hypothetical protein